MPKSAESSKMKESKRTIPSDLLPIYEQLISEYKLFCKKQCGMAWVNYKILADLVNAGWRPTHNQIQE